ncbi:MAG: hypothetical protein ABJC61_13300 [Acidobacteriota bacterium]
MPGEAANAGGKRLFSEAAGAPLAGRCIVARQRGAGPPPGVRRWTFVPDPASRKELGAKADPNEAGDPPCGERGVSPDGIQYIESFPDGPARKVLFARVGQDQPLVDENTLRLLSPPEASRSSNPASREKRTR